MNTIRTFLLCVAALIISTVTAVDGAESKSDGKTKMEKAYFGAGCFWKVQYIFSKIPGVTKTRVGYSGGTTDKPTYKDVCSNTTGHAETVQVEYDPAKVTYHKLLTVFFANHDPTTLNRQGPDVGTQYRSVIFCTNAEQKKEAIAYKEELSKEHKFKAPIVTLIQDAVPFFDAEEYHQNYFVKHGAVCD